MRHLIVNLEAPLMAFGGEMIDNHGVVRRFPAASMLTGLLANALGWRRIERERHQRLQDRLVFAARIDREPAGGSRLRDFQTAQLGASDRGWTTRGRPEGRTGGAATYRAPHLRFRDYWADMRVTVALRLEPGAEDPTLDDLASALDRPGRPPFIGRKPCLPADRLFAGFADRESALAALVATPVEAGADDRHVRLLWPGDEGTAGVRVDRTYTLTDQRNWTSDLHGGGRTVREGTLRADGFAAGRQEPSEARP